MNKYILLLLLGLLTACDNSCSPERAAGFYVAYSAVMHDDYINWDLGYVAKQFIISVENTHKIDERYGTPICRAKIRNKNYYADKILAKNTLSGKSVVAKDSAYVCFTYVPRLDGYIQEYGEGCCKGDRYMYDRYPDYCWL